MKPQYMIFGSVVRDSTARQVYLMSIIGTLLLRKKNPTSLQVGYFKQFNPVRSYINKSVAYNTDPRIIATYVKQLIKSPF